MAALGFLLFVTVIVASSRARDSAVRDPCFRVTGAGRPSPEDLDHTFKCNSGSLSWNFPKGSMNLTFQRLKRAWPCMRLCFDVPFRGAQMTVRETGEVIFNETFTTRARYRSRLPAPRARCIETKASQLDLTIYSYPDINAYVWNTSFVASPCAECERCQGEGLAALYRRSSYAAPVRVTDVLRKDGVVKVNFTLTKYFSRQRTEDDRTVTSMQVITDSCNKMLRSGRKYGLLYTPNDNPQYTFCDVRSVKNVSRHIKPTKVPIPPTTEFSTVKASTDFGIETTTASTDLQTSTTNFVKEGTESTAEVVNTPVPPVIIEVEN